MSQRCCPQECQHQQLESPTVQHYSIENIAVYLGGQPFIIDYTYANNVALVGFGDTYCPCYR